MSTSTENDILPKHSATEAPVRTGDRVAFWLWTAIFLLTIVFTVVMYLFDKFYFLMTGK
jgi:hypothetical protein